MIEQQQVIFVEPILATIVTSGGAGASNLVSADPREIWSFTGAVQTVLLDIDLGSIQLFDSVALINVASDPAMQWAIAYGELVYDTSLFQAPALIQRQSEDGSPTMGMAFAWTANAVSARYIRIYIYHTQSITSIGRVAVGRSWKPSMPHEFGSGRLWQDGGSRTRMENGGLAVVRGDLLSGYAASFGDLDPADLRKIGGMLKRHRSTEPMLLVESPVQPYAEQVHYGTFVDIERYDRRDTSKSRWNIKFEDWA
jgi:hypothetical protein